MTRGGIRADDIFVVRNGPSLEFKAVPPNPKLKYGKRYLVGYVGVHATVRKDWTFFSMWYCESRAWGAATFTSLVLAQARNCQPSAR